MPYDLFWQKNKLFLCIIYGIFFLFLLIPKYEFGFIVFFPVITNSFLLIIIFSIIIFNWEINDITIIIVDIVLIVIGFLISIIFRNYDLIKGIFFVVSFLVSGFLLGDEFVEMLSFRFILSNTERWLIIVGFTISSFIVIPIYFLVLKKRGKVLPKNIELIENLQEIFIIYNSFLNSYFLINLISIALSHKIPIDTIRMLTNEGFIKEYLKDFLYEKYFIYIICYWILWVVLMIFKFALFKKFNIKLINKKTENGI